MPNRVLKESICTSDNIEQLTPFHETMFYRLIVNCDDYGRMDARPKILAAKLFPLKDIRTNQIIDGLRALTSAELVILYEVDGKPFVQMKTWERHQQIRAKKSKYPSPESGTISSDIICNQMTSDDSKCPRNPIQSNPNPKEAGTRVRAREPAASVDDSCVAYCETCLRAMSPGNIEELRSFLCDDNLPSDLIRYAVDDACGHGNRSWAYVAKILNRYVVEGIRTVEQAKGAKAGRNDKKALTEEEKRRLDAEWGGDL